jgi:endonuclease G
MARKPANTNDSRFENEKIESAFQEALRRYGNMSPVTSIVRGFRKVNEGYTDEVVVRITIDPDATSMPEDAFPSDIEGIPLQVERSRFKAEIGYRASDSYLRKIEEVSPHQKFSQVLYPGISVAHKDITAGTLGCLAIDNEVGEVGILSNWHVLAGAAGRPGDEIVQPGTADGGKVPEHSVATLTRMILDLDGDAAFAKLNGARPWSPAIFSTTAVLNGYKRVSEGCRQKRYRRVHACATSRWQPD